MRDYVSTFRVQDFLYIPRQSEERDVGAGTGRERREKVCWRVDEHRLHVLHNVEGLCIRLLASRGRVEGLHFRSRAHLHAPTSQQRPAYTHDLSDAGLYSKEDCTLKWPSRVNNRFGNVPHASPGPAPTHKSATESATSRGGVGRTVGVRSCRFTTFVIQGAAQPSKKLE